MRITAVALVISATVLGSGNGFTHIQSFRSSSDIVPIFVTVTDKEGRLVSGLTREDFQILDNGVAQPVALFDSAPQPISVIALLDVSGSMSENLPILARATAALVQRLREDDVMKLGTFGQRIAFTPAFTRDAPELMKGLPRTVPASAPTPLWRAVDEALTAVGTATSGRRVVVVLSDGKDSGPEIGQKIVTPANLRDRAQKEDVMLYGIGLRSAPGPVAPGGVRSLADVLKSPAPDPTLGSLALGTGGGYVELNAREDLAATFTRIADELHRQYMLGFVPPARDGKEHAVEIRLKRPELTSQARKTYIAPK
ncbi:MAG TPA: VWA domain-containing protein [Vicinamibacterales bacterium]|nr:VWA domain-containing protein [Vicinamibacterales bacterium]